MLAERVDACHRSSNTSLDLSSLELEDWPTDTVNKFITLKTLRISKNKLTSAPSLSRFQTLQTLDLSRNRLISMNLIRISKQLIFLDISHNKLSEFNLPDAGINLCFFFYVYAVHGPDSYSEGMPALETLIMSRNLFSTLPDSLHCLQRLKKLDISHNLITSLNNSLESLVHLEELNMDGNPLDPEAPLPPRASLLIEKVEISQAWTLYTLVF